MVSTIRALLVAAVVTYASLPCRADVSVESDTISFADGGTHVASVRTDGTELLLAVGASGPEVAVDAAGGVTASHFKLAPGGTSSLTCSSAPDVGVIASLNGSAATVVCHTLDAGGFGWVELGQEINPQDESIMLPHYPLEPVELTVSQTDPTANFTSLRAAIDWVHVSNRVMFAGGVKISVADGTYPVPRDTGHLHLDMALHSKAVRDPGRGPDGVHIDIEGNVGNPSAVTFVWDTSGSAGTSPNTGWMVAVGGGGGVWVRLAGMTFDCTNDESDTTTTAAEPTSYGIRVWGGAQLRAEHIRTHHCRYGLSVGSWGADGYDGPDGSSGRMNRFLPTSHIRAYDVVITEAWHGVICDGISGGQIVLEDLEISGWGRANGQSGLYAHSRFCHILVTKNLHIHDVAHGVLLYMGNLNLNAEGVLIEQFRHYGILSSRMAYAEAIGPPGHPVVVKCNVPSAESTSTYAMYATWEGFIFASNWEISGDCDILVRAYGGSVLFQHSTSTADVSYRYHAQFNGLAFASSVTESGSVASAATFESFGGTVFDG